jgi:hypothetical protein
MNKTCGKFKKGQSGNPSGRPPGIPNPSTRLRQQIAEHVPAIIDRLVESARAGDTAAANLLLSRVLPPARAESLSVLLPAGQTLGERAEAITAAALNGEMPTSVAGDLMAVLQGQARVKELDEIEQRLAAIEGRLG